MHRIVKHIKQVGVNEAFGLWRLRLGGMFGLGHGGTTLTTFSDVTLREIVQHAEAHRKSGNESKLTCIWMVIDGPQDEVENCADWVRQQCPHAENTIFDFVTSDDNDGQFLDGSLSLVVPAGWEPGGVLGFLGNLVSNFPGLMFDGSALEFHDVGLEPHSGSAFLGRDRQLRFESRRFTNYAQPAAA
jgi:hypothetical protein